MLDMNELKKICLENQTAEIITIFLAKRQRHRSTINTTRFKRDILAKHRVLNLQEFREFWYKLEALGVGKIKGHIFNLNYDLITLAGDVRTSADKGIVVKFIDKERDERLANLEKALKELQNKAEDYINKIDELNQHL